MKKHKKKSSKQTPLTRHHLELNVIREQYILLSNLQSVLKLDKNISHSILTKIMRFLFEERINLFALPFTSDLCKSEIPIQINGKLALDPVHITREVLRVLLCEHMKGKERCKVRLDLITEQFQLKNGENTLYSRLMCEEWSFYLRIFNRLKRNYQKICRDIFNAERMDNQNELDKLRIKKTSLLCELPLFLTLAVKLEDLLKISVIPETIREIAKSFLDQHDKKRTKLNGEFIFAEYIHRKKGDPNATNEDVAKGIYDQYAESLESIERTLRIIYEERKQSIEKQLTHHMIEIANKNDNKTSTIDEVLDEPDTITKIAKDNFTTTNQVKKIGKNRKIADSVAKHPQFHLIDYSKKKGGFNWPLHDNPNGNAIVSIIAKDHNITTTEVKRIANVRQHPSIIITG